MSRIPVLSLKKIVEGTLDADTQIAGELLPILQSWGAFQLVDHGVPQPVMAGAFKAAEKFFALPLEDRLTISVARDNRGYVPMHQTHYPGNKPDLKESFNVGRLSLTADDPDVKAGKPLHAVNRWPALGDFREPVESYFSAVTALGDRLLGPLAICLGMTPAALRECYDKPVAFMRLFHYPPNGSVDEKEFGAAEHKDYGFLTILAQDANGGLEVRSPDDVLVPVPPRTDTFVINVGDMLSEITGGRFRSPLHRVVNRSGVARYSIPYFFDPDFDATFEAMPDISAGQYLLNKFDKFYKYRQQPTAASQ
jgi:isopenicillin N synthase-like dioxygenase